MNDFLLYQQFGQHQNTTSRNRLASAPSNLSSGDSLLAKDEREQFALQLEMLAETNKRLGESNDDLRAALSVGLFEPTLYNRKMLL